MSYQQPPFDSSTVRRGATRGKDAWIIGGTVVGVLAMLGIGAWAVVAITSGRNPPVQGDGGTQTVATVDPMAAAAAQQFADALANDDVAAAKLVVCSSENPQPANEKVPYTVKSVTVTGSTGTVTLVKGEDIPLPMFRLAEQDGGWKVCGTA